MFIIRLSVVLPSKRKFSFNFSVLDASEIRKMIVRFVSIIAVNYCSSNEMILLSNAYENMGFIVSSEFTNILNYKSNEIRVKADMKVKKMEG